MAKTSTKIRKSVWEVLSRIDCSKYVEKKGRFNYLSWSWAWGILKEHYPKANFEYIKTENGKTAFKDEEGYAFVRVAVTVEDETVEEDLAVMDNNNNDIQNPKPTQINNSLKRCLVKAMAFHGLGINVYAGEDLLMFDTDEVEVAIARQAKECATARQTARVMAEKKITEKQRKALEAYIDTCDDGDIKLRKVLEYYKIDNLSEMAEEDATAALTKLEITV